MWMRIRHLRSRQQLPVVDRPHPPTQRPLAGRRRGNRQLDREHFWRRGSLGADIRLLSGRRLPLFGLLQHGEPIRHLHGDERQARAAPTLARLRGHRAASFHGFLDERVAQGVIRAGWPGDDVPRSKEVRRKQGAPLGVVPPRSGDDPCRDHEILHPLPVRDQLSDLVLLAQHRHE